MSSINENSKAPAWINKEFFEEAFRKYRNDSSIQVLSYKFGEGFSEHFASEMYSCQIEFHSSKFSKTEFKNVVLKVQPSNESSNSAVVSDRPLFETEIRMYTKTIPAINELFKRSGLKCELAPELIYASDNPFPLLILEDARDEGFSSPRSPPEEFEDSKLIIQRLAQFHAASFFLAENMEHDFEEYSHSVYDNKYIIDAFFAPTFNAFKASVASWEGYEEFIPKIEKFIENLSEIGKACDEKNQRGIGYNVLNHVDFHCRNLLTKYNEFNRLEKLKFIDFQTCLYTSPALDVLKIASVVKADEHGNIPRREELIMYYHKEFVEALKSFGYMKTPPTLLDLNVELMKRGSVYVLYQITYMPYQHIDWSQLDVNTFLGDSNPEDSLKSKMKLFENPKVQQLLKDGLKEWITKGWL